MLITRRALVAAALMLGLSPAMAFAQAYPSKPITLVVPFAAGGPTDIIARLVGDSMGRTLGQNVVVENQAGAGGTTASGRLSKAPPDGYTIMMGNLGTHAASVGLYGTRLSYDPRTDFEPIMNVAGTPMLVAARKDLPVKDFKEFVAWVKANETKANYGTGGVGATSHLTCLFLDSLMDAKPTHVPFRGSGPALNAVLGGHVDYVCDQTVGVVPSIQCGQLKGIVAAVEKRLPSVPDVPTSVEQGMPAFQAIGWNALFAPKGTPKDIVDKINAAARAAVKDEKVRARLLELGAEIPAEDAQTPAALSAHVKAEVDKWLPVIKKAGVSAE